MNNEEVLTAFREYLPAKIGSTWSDICNPDQAVSIARLLSEGIGVPLAELRVSQIKEFTRNLRKAAVSKPVPSEILKCQRKLTASRAYLAIDLFLSFRKEVLKARGVRP
jgi:hypothetical protein